MNIMSRSVSEEVWYTLNHGCAIYSTGGHDHPILLNVGVWNPPAKFLLWPWNIDILVLTPEQSLEWTRTEWHQNA